MITYQCQGTYLLCCSQIVPKGKNTESIHHWHPEKAISCNLEPSKIQKFFTGTFGKTQYLKTILTEMNSQILPDLHV